MIIYKKDEQKIISFNISKSKHFSLLDRGEALDVLVGELGASGNLYYSIPTPSDKYLSYELKAVSPTKDPEIFSLDFVIQSGEDVTVIKVFGDKDAIANGCFDHCKNVFQSVLNAQPWKKLSDEKFSVFTDVI